MLVQGVIESSGTDFAIRFILYHVFLDLALVSASSVSMLLRLGLVLGLAHLTLQMHYQAASLTDIRIINKFCSQYIWGLLLRGIPMILLVDAKQPESRTGGVWWQRALWEAQSLWNYRGIGTPKVINKIPPFSMKNQSWIPSRGRFILHHVCSFAVSVLLLRLFLLMPIPDVEAFSATKEHLFSRLSHVTATELLTRTIFTASEWAKAFLSINIMYDIPALIIVGSRLSSPSNWPPIWGPLSGAYSIRRFWGVVWHQQMHTPLKDNASIITTQILRLPPGTLVSQYAKFTVVFLISGLWHFAGDFGLPNAENGTVGFFLLQAGGIMFEDAVRELYRYCGWYLPKFWERRIGYLWLVTFMIWSTPKWGYPKMRYNML